jgi:serine/threonine protein kinase
MALTSGTRLGPYEIAAPLGAGGMGEVWRARDTRLDRQVAIKALPGHLAGDPDRLARFEREAKVLASLNHPNIGAIYGMEEVGGHQYLVLEFVEGETLAGRLSRDSIAVDEALSFAKQIAEALEIAHEKGVIHRDLKPGNVMITPEGMVKVLDFGLARTADSIASTNAAPFPADSPTVTSPVAMNSPTIPGAIMGTAGYMSPEQARGRPVDKRSDIFSFGCVLYEMLTGTQPFRGETVSDSLGAVLHRDPDWGLLPAGTPARLRELLMTCLAKDRRHRLRDIGDARLALEKTDAGNPDVHAAAASTRSLLPWAIALMCVLIAVGAWFRVGAGDPAQMPVVRSSIEIAPRSLINNGDGPIALSPDGRTLAFVGREQGETPRIWTRPLDSLSAQPLQGTDNATYPFWSPDGKNLGYFAKGKLRRIPAAGGTPIALADVEEPRGGCWSVDGIIVFAPGPYTALMRIPATGGTAIAITKLVDERNDRETHRLPCFLPDGRHVIYTSGAGGFNDSTCKIQLLNLESEKSISLIDAKSQGLYAPPGYLLFVRDAALMAQRLDVAAEKLIGEPVVVAEQVSLHASRFTSPISVSSNGLLVYRATESLSRLAWLDAEGRSVGAFGDAANFENLDLSAKGDKASAVIRRESGEMDLWLVDMIRGTRVLLVENVSGNSARWCPPSLGSTTLAYWDASDKARLRETEGNRTDTVLTEGFVNDWSQDGKLVSIVRQNRATNTDLYLMDLASKQVRPYLVTTDWEEYGAFSPDGLWIAFTSTRSGKMELFVAPVANSSAARPVIPFSRSNFLTWLDDGTLMYSDPSRTKLSAITTKTSPTDIELGTPKPAFGGMEIPVNTYAVTRDGKRLLAAIPVGGNTAESLVLIQNWQGTMSTGR